MSARRLLLILFLYCALVWVFAAMRSDVNLGFSLTIVGIAVALLVVIVQQILSWWRSRRGRAGAEPPRPTPKATALNEDAAALDALRREAISRLAASSGRARLGGSGFSGRALILLIGPSGSGKTQTMVHSGLDPQLLAGQVRGGSSSDVVPTRVANFWLAQEGIFVELSGHLYESDQERWISLLKVLCGDSGKPLWKRLWRDEQRPVLRAVLLFHDTQGAMSPPDGPAGGAQARVAQERLQAVAAVFGITVPVYAIFTKTDSVKFYGEYFGRLPQSEAAEAFGYTLANDPPTPTGKPMPWAEREGRRLTKAFGAVYRRLAERRLLQLMRESDPSRKPDIYEFPREFRRIRGALVQTLTDAFQPDPLKPGPELRGFYFTGTRMAENEAPDQTVHDTDPGLRAARRDASAVDYGEATHLFKPGSFKLPGRNPSGVSGRAELRQQWIFTKQLFLETIPRDLPPVATTVAQPAIEKYRVWLTRAVVGISLLMGLIWLQSWWRNWRLIQRAEVAIEQADRAGTRSASGPASLTTLQSIDRLRVEILSLGSKPWAMRWGLYTGDDVRQKMELVYFRHLDALLLGQLNQRLADRLSRLPATPDESAQFEPVYRQLATHLAITSAGCKPVEPEIVSSVLKDETREVKLAEDPERSKLTELQLDFYAQKLPAGNPVRLPENQQARTQARLYLDKVQSIDRIYQAILARASQKLQGSVRLADLAGDTSTLLRGPTEVPAVFTPRGWSIFDKEASEAPNVTQGDPCVLGTGGGFVAEKKRDTDLSRKVRIKYLQEYKEHWKRFIDEQSVEQYGGLEDAVKKLERLSGPKSPVLGLLAFSSNNTSFPSAPADLTFVQEAAKKIEGIGKGAKAVEKAIAPNDPEESPARMSKAFQPVHWVVPPDAPNWVGEKNLSYINALADLKQSLVAIGRSSGTDPAVHQQATQAADKAMDAARQLAIGFTSIGSEGLDLTVQRLLEAPIRRARLFIQENPEKAQSGRLNGELNKFCRLASPILSKYPFAPTSKVNASLDEVGLLFAPGAGAIWKLQQDPLSDLAVRQGAQWVAKTEGQKLRPSQEFLLFINRVQTLTDTLYSGKTAQPSLQYTLRPVEGSLKGFGLTLDFDGRKVEFSEASPSQRQFTWPAAAGIAPGAKAWISVDRGTTYFGSSEGLWGVFRVFGEADSRELGSKQVQWSGYGVAGGRVPFATPVRLEFVGSPGAAELLNPKFFEGLRCPGRAIQ